MATKTFYLDNESTESVSISHGLNWKNLTIEKDGEMIGQVENVKALEQGQAFQLSDGSVLSLKLIKKLGFMQELEILLNGTPIPGSGTEPNQQIKQVYHLLLFIAGINAILGLAAELADIGFLKSLGLGYGTVVIGIVYALLAYFVKFRHSVVALYIAIGLMLLDIIFTLVFAAEMGGNPTSGLLMKAFLTYSLFRGIPALKKVRDQVLTY
ncbi:hypothetical protein [Pontibacter liquoris]|uniref:hypothetical protein n=1 Tax=Pontibacter liquoris TaxID=2905677 RepID=UPI001FA6BF18|nr:hypothetical protein [Pontibacter liquoris]